VPDPAPSFDESYFSSSSYSEETGIPYERHEAWLALFGAMADYICTVIAPRTVLDAGCAKGFLVEALRDRGVEAYGVDISEYALRQVREDVRPFCWQASLAEPLPDRYDLIVCIETLEHMPPADSERAIINITAHTDDLIFSSSPIHFREATHINLRPPEHWAERFAARGLRRDFETDLSTVISDWAVRFRRRQEPLPELVDEYERRLSVLAAERTGLRRQLIEDRAGMAQRTPAEVELAAIKQSRSWRGITAARTGLRRLLPPESGRGRATSAVFDRIFRR
jgi:SAM-dependent methyltransferase